MKLARDVPEPPVITAELRKWLVAEAQEWRAEISEKVKAVERLTSDDLRMRIR